MTATGPPNTASNRSGVSASSGRPLKATRPACSSTTRVVSGMISSTLILVTHHVEEIIPETTRVVLLQAGRIAFDGPPEDALTPERLEKVFGGPVAVTRGGGYYHVRADGNGR